MQILLVANGNYKHLGARYYEPQKKLYNGLVRNGHNVYFFSDRDDRQKRIVWKGFGTKKIES